MKKRFLRCLFALQAHRLGRLLLRRRILVLAYHGFTDLREHPGIENSHGKHLDIDRFRQHVAYLKAHYNVVPLERVVNWCAGTERLPPNSVAITIDDGYESVYRLAYPVLQHYRVPATIFVTTGFVEGKEPLWTDRLEYALSATSAARLDVTIGNQARAYEIADRRGKLACDGDLRSRLKVVPQESRPEILEDLERRLGQSLHAAADAPAVYRPLDWRQIREMVESGLVTIGGHTVSHVILTRCSSARARSELLVSKQVIEEKTGTRCDQFCYPNGQLGCFDAGTRALLQQAGYSCGVTTVFGTNGPGTDVFELKRFYFDDRGEFVRFVMTLSGIVGVLDGVKRLVTGRRKAESRPVARGDR